LHVIYPKKYFFQIFFHMSHPPASPTPTYKTHPSNIIDPSSSSCVLDLVGSAIFDGGRPKRVKPSQPSRQLEPTSRAVEHEYLAMVDCDMPRSWREQRLYQQRHNGLKLSSSCSRDLVSLRIVYHTSRTSSSLGLIIRIIVITINSYISSYSHTLNTIANSGGFGSGA